MASNIREPHVAAQRLNEHAAFCIEIGFYERAISSLIEALQLAEEAEQSEEACRCSSCTLEACMSFSQNISLGVTSSRNKISQNEDNGCSDEQGFIYRKPIRTTPQAIQEGHASGVVLPLIIVFNLALANHLSALENQSIMQEELQKVLQLYELAYRWQLEEQENPLILDSLRFTMIIANNLGEIHRAVDNKSKHDLCLQHLLSTMMFMVDGQSQSTANHPIELDGFFRNATKLILQEPSAAAA